MRATAPNTGIGSQWIAQGHAATALSHAVKLLRSLIMRSLFAADERDSECSFRDASWLLSAFALLHRKPFDAALFAQRFPPPLNRARLRDAVGELGMDIQFRNCRLSVALAWHLPLAIRVHQDPENP